LRLEAGGPRRHERCLAARALAFALVIGACASPAPDPERRTIPGTRIALFVPDGFAVSQRFPGLEREDGVTSVMVTEVPGPVAAIRDALDAEGLADRGMRLLDSEEVVVGGRQALLVHAQLELAPGAVLRRWILVFGEGQATAMLSASTPLAVEDRLGPVLRKVLLGAEWSPEARVDTWAGLGFTLTESDALKVSDRLPNMISFTRGGHRGALSPSEPLFLAGSAVSGSGVRDLEAFARRQLSGIAEIEAIAVDSSRSLELDGLPAHELVASARDVRTGLPLHVYQVVAADGDRYFVLQGIVGADGADAFMPQFRELAASFRRARPAPK